MGWSTKFNWIGAGLKWGEVIEQTRKLGLAPLAGSSPTVSVTGYTLGGGYGWLGRRYGLATDSVLSFELVDANGQILQISQDEHSDLFWGLRGGGGSLGVITAMQIRLYPVTQVYAGNLIFPVDQAREVM
jgi:FAD/FMN-containing dehydrogenase